MPRGPKAYRPPKAEPRGERMVQIQDLVRGDEIRRHTRANIEKVTKVKLEGSGLIEVTTTIGARLWRPDDLVVKLDPKPSTPR